MPLWHGVQVVRNGPTRDLLQAAFPSENRLAGLVGNKEC